jgi:hypothetical protein
MFLDSLICFLKNQTEQDFVKIRSKYMHRYVSAFLLLTISFLSFTCYLEAENYDLMPSQQLSNNQQIEYVFHKVYVQPSQIYFSENQMFVQSLEGLIPINSLKTDCNGIHYEIVHPYSWVCKSVDSRGKKCGHYNSNTYYCEHCGRSPDDDR